MTQSQSSLRRLQADPAVRLNPDDGDSGPLLPVVDQRLRHCPAECTRKRST